MNSKGYGAEKLFDAIARTATPTPAVRTSGSAKGIYVTIHASAPGASPSVVFNVEGHDRVTDTWFLLLASAAIVAAGDTTMLIYPGAIAAANLVSNKPIPEEWRVRPVHTGTDALTYLVGVELLP